VDWCFRGKVNRVIDYNQVDVIFDLGFKVKFREMVILPGYSVNDHQYSSAKACLIVLIGGHRIVLNVSKKEQSSIYEAKIFLYHTIKMDDIFELALDRRLPCVNKIMSKMESLDFNVDELKSKIVMAGNNE
jgi:hypothetical protein